MNAKRKQIPKEVETAVLIKSRRRCCLCYFWEQDLRQQDGQIAHIDRDPSNPAEDNLAWLCFRHHNQYEDLFPPDHRPAALARLLQSLAAAKRERT